MPYHHPPYIASLRVNVLLYLVPMVYSASRVVVNSIVSSDVPSALRETVWPPITQLGNVTVSVVPSAVAPPFNTIAIR